MIYKSDFLKYIFNFGCIHLEWLSLGLMIQDNKEINASLELASSSFIIFPGKQIWV